MVIGRKPKKIDMRLKDESVEQVYSLKYLRCNISSIHELLLRSKAEDSNGKRSFNRKRSIFCGPLEKRTKEETSEVFCVECSVVWCRDLDTTTE